MKGREEFLRSAGVVDVFLGVSGCWLVGYRESGVGYPESGVGYRE